MMAWMFGAVITLGLKAVNLIRERVDQDDLMIVGL